MSYENYNSISEQYFQGETSQIILKKRNETSSNIF